MSMNQSAFKPVIRRAALRAVTLLLCVSSSALLTGCTEAEVQRFYNALAVVLAVAAVIVIISMIISALVFLAEVALIVFNFARPSKLSMVAGFVVGGVQMVFSVGGGMMTAFQLVNLSGSEFTGPGAHAGPDPAMILPGVLSLLFSLAFNALIIGSSFHARRKLQEQRAEATEGPALMSE